ncbi:MAG: SsrA-binding protein SmpB [Phycisphaerae bacterium]|nr:SsrA-binding protein SmpB [Phycisphaerae bacterium]
MAKKTLATPRIRNRKAHHRFEILDKLQCGLVLCGTEVKSLRAGQASLEEAFAYIADGEAWLRDFHIAPYSHGHTINHEPKRRRKLLLHRQEIRKLETRIFHKGLTLVPLEVYFNERGLAKVLLAVARGKSHTDKRQTLKKAEHRREMDRALRRRR